MTLGYWVQGEMGAEVKKLNGVYFFKTCCEASVFGTAIITPPQFL